MNTTAQEKKSKLSALIRESIPLYPQEFEDFIGMNDLGGITGACALGTGYISYKKDQDINWHNIGMYEMNVMIAACGINPLIFYPFPEGIDKQRAGEDIKDTIGDIIVWLNDDERWTRELIADWLESIGF